eukprot:808365_1
MSPDVFESLGKHGGGRMTKNKLRRAVSSVLSAWTNWSVYNSTFMDELESKFEGRKIEVEVKLNEELDKTEEDEKMANKLDNMNEDGDDKKYTAAASTIPRGTWTSAENIDEQHTSDVDGEVIDGLDGEVLDDLDG